MDVTLGNLKAKLKYIIDIKDFRFNYHYQFRRYPLTMHRPYTLCRRIMFGAPQGGGDLKR